MHAALFHTIQSMLDSHSFAVAPKQPIHVQISSMMKENNSDSCKFFVA